MMRLCSRQFVPGLSKLTGYNTNYFHAREAKPPILLIPQNSVLFGLVLDILGKAFELFLVDQTTVESSFVPNKIRKLYHA